MKKLMFVLASLALTIFSAQGVYAQCSSNQAKAVKASYTTGAEKDVVDIAIGSTDHTTLVAAVKAAGLVETLKSDGPFTIFAPTNAAFDKLPEGTVATLLKPENKGQLTSVLTYHVVNGKLDSGAVVDAIKKGNGKVEVTTIQGGTLTAMMKDGAVWLKDENGGMAKITAVDLEGTNGTIHVIDSVVLPK
ncbi:MAG: fasciclin domain-containing protein [Saprospiraceae bacterium]|nr:fasciclin domain-containing protein [Saprospiraceae bacterium]